MYEYRMEVLRIVDGDTIHADVDLGCDTHIKMTIRLAGINAPEMGTPEGVQAKSKLEELLPLGQVVLLSTVKDKREKYGRYLGWLTAGGTRVNDEMIASGNAVAYDGGSRDKLGVSDTAVVEKKDA